MPAFTLVLGPSGGGKSRWAEHLAASCGAPVIYLATGPSLPEDPAWQAKLQQHRSRRPSHWTCLEVGGDLIEALRHCEPDSVALVDSLGTWLAAWLDQSQSSWNEHCDSLVRGLKDCPAALLLVAEEVGWSVVPATEDGMRFRSRLTQLLQRLQPMADQTWLVVADRALDLDRLGIRIPSVS